MRWTVTRTVQAGAMGVYEAGQVVDITDAHAGWLVATYGEDVLAPPPVEPTVEPPDEDPVGDETAAVPQPQRVPPRVPQRTARARRTRGDD